jgi:hypothetical protein
VDVAVGVRGARNAWLVRVGCFLAQLEDAPARIGQLRADSQWEPRSRWEPRCAREGCCAARGPTAARAACADCGGGLLSGPAQLRHLRGMERAVRRYAHAVAEDGSAERAVSSLHLAFQTRLAPPLRQLAAIVSSARDGSASTTAGAADAADAHTRRAAELRGAVERLQVAFHESRMSSFYESDAAHAAESTAAYLEAYASSVNSFLLSATLFATTLLAPTAQAAEPQRKPDAPLPAAVAETRAAGLPRRCVGCAAAADAGGGGGLFRAVAHRLRGSATGLVSARAWNGRRGAQAAAAVLLASTVVLLPVARATFGSAALFAPLEASLLLEDRAGASAQQSSARLLGTVAGATVGFLFALMDAGMAGEPDGVRSALKLSGLALWAFVACLLRPSKTHGYAAIVASWTAPIVIAGAGLTPPTTAVDLAPQSGGFTGAAAELALARCAMALVGASSCVLTASVLAPRWALAQLPTEIALAVSDASALLAHELAVWHHLLRSAAVAASKLLREQQHERSACGDDAHALDVRAKRSASAHCARPPDAKPDCDRASLLAAYCSYDPAGEDDSDEGDGATDSTAADGAHGARDAAVAAADVGERAAVKAGGSRRGLRTPPRSGGWLAPFLIASPAWAERSAADAGARLEQTRARWAQTVALVAEAEAEAALCGGTDGGANVLHALGRTIARGGVLVGSLELVRDAIGASTCGTARELLGSDAHTWVGAPFADSLANVAAGVAALGRVCAHALQILASGENAPVVRLAAERVAEASASMRAERALLARLDRETVAAAIASGRASPLRRLSVLDALLHISATEAALGAAAQLLKVAAEVERVCERAAASSPQSADALGRAWREWQGVDRTRSTLAADGGSAQPAVRRVGANDLLDFAELGTVHIVRTDAPSRSE